jgi:hypothetical protein
MGQKMFAVRRRLAGGPEAPGRAIAWALRNEVRIPREGPLAGGRERPCGGWRPSAAAIPGYWDCGAGARRFSPLGRAARGGYSLS